MQIRFKTLLASSLLVLIASSSTAEQAMGFGSQGPIWGGNGPAPIAWGDCIPVPIAPNNMMPFNGMPMGNMMGNDFAPFPMQGGNMIPMPQQRMAPPSPFFGSAPVPAMPPAGSLPMMPPPQVAPVACDDESQKQLHALQGRYNQASAASKAKIEEITLTMQDAQNQMADARIIIEKLSKQQEADQIKIASLELVKKNNEENLGKVLSYADDLAKLKQGHAAVSKENAELKVKFTKMDNAYRFMQSKLTKLKSEQTIGAVTNINSSQSKNIITALKANVANLEKENNELKVTFTKMDNAYRFMESKLAKLTSQQTMNAVTNINNDQSKSIIEALKAKVTSLDSTNKTLQSQLGTLQNEAGSQARKLTAFGQSATELTALQSAYKARNDENAVLKAELAKVKIDFSATTMNSTQSKSIIEALNAKIASLGNNNKTLQSQLGTLQAEAGAQARKLTVLGQSSAELVALKSAYKSKNADNQALMHKLIELNNSNKTLQSKVGTYEMEAGSQARKLTALGQSATELTALQSAYKARNDENAELKARLTTLQSDSTAATLNSAQSKNIIMALKNKVAALGDSNKTLQSQLGTLHNNAGAQSRKLTALGQSATELSALKSAYKARNNENAQLKAKLGKLDSLQTSTVLKDAQNKNIIDELKKKLVALDGQRKSCITKTAALETTSSNQVRKINALTSKTAECVALKSAYDSLNSKKADLSTQLTAATADDDSDGILNSLDKCPTSPAGSNVNAKGCPDIKDADTDGVADANDLCANTVAGTTVNEFGCTATDNITLKGVTFNVGSATLRQSSFPVLDAAADTLNKASDLKVQVSGYTDYQGSAAINKRLSQRRANTVMIYLIRKGVNAGNLSAVGYGEKNPIATNETAAGRATNRRVELKIK